MALNKSALQPVRFTDTTLRDAHQSLWATRLRTDDILNIIDVVDSVGYYSLEVWGGATFDVCLRFLRENPWERLRAMKAKAKKTPFQMLIRGQNVVGYKNYADDLVDRFVALACENGIDIFRCFDALNDTRNIESCVKAVKKHGGHAQGTLCYTISPAHTLEKFIGYAKEQVAIGVDSICIKDMAGILSPVGATNLVSALVKAVDVPIQIHSHASSGMAMSTYFAGVHAGSGAIDCAVSSMAGYSSQPPVETLAVMFKETPYAANLDMEAIEKVATYFAKLGPERRQSNTLQPWIDPDVLIHQVPGGMISNFRSQLEMQNALDKMPEVLKEVSMVREDLGFPPLVTPTSQIVGTQAVMNVLAGERYKMVPNEVKDYARGKYGRSPEPMKDSMIKKILGDEKVPAYKKPDPTLAEGAKSADPQFVQNEEDLISYVMLPEPAMEYFKWRALPAAERGPTPADLELKKQKEANAAPATSEVSASVLEQLAGPLVGELLAKIEGLTVQEVVLTKDGNLMTVHPSGVLPGARVSAPINSTQGVAPVAITADTPVVAEYTKTINAPLVGKFYSAAGPGKPAFVAVGDVVEAGAKVCIVEAMKLFNEITSSSKCKIVKILVEEGTTVQKDQPLIAVEDV